MKSKSPLFSRVGSKWRIKDKILNVIPPHKTYIEPFVGGGSIFFYKDASEKSIINDLDEQLINSYKLLNNLEKEQIKTPDIDYTNIEEIRKYYYDDSFNTDSDKLLKYIILMSGSFCCMGKGKIYKKINLNNKIKDIDFFKQKLKQAEILNKSYEEVIENYDDEDAFFFIDPPYEKSKQIYKHGGFDFHKLQTILSKIKGKFLLTINDSENIREIFKNYIIIPVIVRGSAGKEIDYPRLGNGSRNELFISNYSINGSD